MKLVASTIALLVATCLCAQASRAGTTVTSEQTTFEYFVPCANDGAGEIVRFSGTFRSVATVVYDRSGNPRLGGVHYQWGSSGGVGLTTGESYVLAATERSGFVDTATGSLSTTLLVWKVIGRGLTADLTLRQHLQFFFDNATHEIRIHSDQLTFDCTA